MEAQEILRLTNRTHMFSVLCVIAFGLSALGIYVAILMGNPFLAPVKNVFEEFLSKIKLSNPDIVAAILDMKKKIDNEVFHEWCDGLILLNTETVSTITLESFTEESRFANGRVCPLCGSAHIVQNGHRKDGVQRYMCRDCNNNYVFPIRPKCRSTLEWEYQAYCDRCGQKLGWKKFNKAKIKKWNDKL